MIYKNTTVYTYELMKKFLLFPSKKKKRTIIFYIIFSIVLLMILIGSAVENGLNIVFWGLLLLLVATLFLNSYNLYLMPLSRAKKSLVMRDSVNIYDFYDDKFRIKSDAGDYEGSNTVFYSSLYAVYDTKEYYYMYINKNQAYIIDKTGFISDDDFPVFIKNKVKNYIKKKQ